MTNANNKLEQRFEEVTVEAVAFTRVVAPKLEVQTKELLKASNELLNSKMHEMEYVQKDIEATIKETEVFINEYLKPIQEKRNYIQAGVTTAEKLEDNILKEAYLNTFAFIDNIKRNTEELNRLLQSTKSLLNVKAQS